MEKFKVGDRLKVTSLISSTDVGYLKVGEIHEVVHVDERELPCISIPFDYKYAMSYAQVEKV